MVPAVLRARAAARTSPGSPPTPSSTATSGSINGQKVWNTSAHHAEYGMLLARTDWSVPKHRGITYFVIKMHQPGVHVRPLRQMNGYASFNEVFLDDARVPVVRRDRRSGGGLAGRAGHPGPRARPRRPIAPARYDTAAGRVLREAQAEWDDRQRALQVVPAARRARPISWSSGPRRRAATTIRSIRQEIAALAEPRPRRAVDGAASRGQPGPRPAARCRGVARQAQRQPASPAPRPRCTAAWPAPSAMLAGRDSVLDGLITEILVSVPGGSIAGGTDEIQHNIIGERVLGPAEGAADRHQHPVLGGAEERRPRGSADGARPRRCAHPLRGGRVGAGGAAVARVRRVVAHVRPQPGRPHHRPHGDHVGPAGPRRAATRPPIPTAYSAALAVADMAALLDAAGADRAVVGGHSLGGYLSLAFHLAHPERVAALVLIDTGPGLPQRRRSGEVEPHGRELRRRSRRSAASAPSAAAGSCAADGPPRAPPGSSTSPGGC